VYLVGSSRDTVSLFELFEAVFLSPGGNAALPGALRARVIRPRKPTIPTPLAFLSHSSPFSHKPSEPTVSRTSYSFSLRSSVSHLARASSSSLLKLTASPYCLADGDVERDTVSLCSAVLALS